MLSKLFLGLSLVGAEWVLYILIILSIFSIALILERFLFYKAATSSLDAFRRDVRLAIEKGNWDELKKLSLNRMNGSFKKAPDLESLLVAELSDGIKAGTKMESLSELSNSAILQARIKWDKNLAVLATIGTNAPFIGLFGTVLGIIQAFHDLSSQAASGVQGVTGGISEALVATAVGILVAIPATIAYNLFSRRVRTAIQEAESLKSYIIGKSGK